MFARHVFMHLKPNSAGEFTRTLDQEIIPVLRKLRGFQDEIAFVVPDGTEALGISLWDRKEDADTYNRRDVSTGTQGPGESGRRTSSYSNL